MPIHVRPRHAGSLLFIAAGCLVLAGCSDPLAGNTGPLNIEVKMPKNEAELKARVDEVLEYTERRYMDTGVGRHAAWQIMHGVLAYPDTLLVVHKGEHVNCLEWLLNGGDLRGFDLQDTPFGIDTVLEGGSKMGQGHDDQWLCILSQAGLKWDQKFIYKDKLMAEPVEKTGTIAEMVRATQWGAWEKVQDYDNGSARANPEIAELSWSIIGLTAFPEHVSFDEPWVLKIDADRIPKEGLNEKEQAKEKEIARERTLSMEDIVRVETKQAQEGLGGAACGGTHRLIGLAMAVKRYQAWKRSRGEDDKLSGAWQEAHGVVRTAIATVKEFQNADGSFSASWLERSSTNFEFNDRISKSGHTLEFLAIALTDDELTQPWVIKAVAHLCELFDRTQKLEIECGGLYHAAHGLVVYRERRWGKFVSATVKGK